MSKRVVCLMLLILILVFALGCEKEEPLSLAEKFNGTTSGEFIIDEPGIYGNVDETKEFKGNLHVEVAGVTLQNVNIIGDLILAEEIGEGDVELINLNISNTVYIYGGGENSIRFKRTKSKHTLVYKPRKPVRIVVDKESEIEKITVQSSAILEGDSFSKVSIEPKEENTKINLTGTFKKVEIKGTTNIVTPEKTHIENMIINEHAKKTEIAGDGNILNVEVNAEKVHINVRVENVYTNNNINRVIINNEEINIIIDTEEIYHTADTWEVGMPWDLEWGEEPEGAWRPDSGILWNPEWGPEPDDLNLPYEEENVLKEPEEPEETEIIIDSEEMYQTADTWEVGMPWDPEWGPEPDDIDIPEEENIIEVIEFEFITCNYIATSSPNTLEITVSLTKPGTVYYVFEDVSVMFGSKYLPSIDQIMQGNNALGSPDPKSKPDIGDDDFEFFTEAFVHGEIAVAEAGIEYKIVIDGPTFAGMEGESFLDSPSGFRRSIVAVDENGNKIIKQ